MNAEIGRMAALAQYYAALTRGRSLAGTRALRDGPTAGELLLEADVADALGGPLGEMYRRPIEAGLLAMVGQTEAEIGRSVLRFYEERPDVPAGVGAVLRQAARRGFNLGGQMGLGELGLEGQFALTETALLDQLDDHVDGLMDTRPAAEMSLAVTTAGEIGREVSRRRDLGETVVDMLPGLSAWVLGRTVIRSAMIAATETVRMTRWGMVSAFVGNGIRGVRHECEADVDDRCYGKICPPFCGVEYELTGVLDPMGGIPGAAQIPLHPNCRCWYSPRMDGWLKPVLIWTGFALALLNNEEE